MADAVRFIWTGSKKDLLLFFDSLRSNRYNLTFTMETSQPVTFLDIQIFVNSEGMIGSTLFRKPYVWNSLLHASSSHPAILPLL